MKISIIGSGNMGRSVGILWAEGGHEVFFGSRDPEKGQAIANRARFLLEVVEAVSSVWGGERVGIKQSLSNTFYGMHDSNSEATFAM
ncbi:MAG: NAD(P)-binding domain-containing protein [Nostoc sp.]|uniref:NAD(P)-binding domain-containing protein n=1 Tax=Nostoc sp. TaxID=1180 RepID=UPI002FF6A281